METIIRQRTLNFQQVLLDKKGGDLVYRKLVGRVDVQSFGFINLAALQEE